MSLQLANGLTVRFRYFTEENQLPSGLKSQDKTECVLLQSTTEKDDKLKPVASGVVTRYYSDTPNKTIARKKSFTRALAELIADKNARRALQQEFLSKIRGAHNNYHVEQEIPEGSPLLDIA